MILADKLIELRKKNGWSQEELAGQLGVSRQSVSKWESGASIPDLDKILKLSSLFGVSTDFLLKDSEELSPPEPEQPGSAVDASDPVRVFTLAEANEYLSLVRRASGKIALGVALCILSPTLLILFGALSDKEGGHALPEAVAVGVGLPVLFVMVAAAVALFLLFGRPLEQYEFLDKEPFELAYGVSGIVKKQRDAYAPTHAVSLVAGVSLCILSVIPLLVSAALSEDGMAVVIGVLLLFVLVAGGVFLLVRSCCIQGGFLRLLEEGDFTREKKFETKQSEPLAVIYWCAVTAVYLAVSFYFMNWHRSWIIWPVAAVFYGVVLGIAGLVRRGR